MFFKRKEKFNSFSVKVGGRMGTVIGINENLYIVKFKDGICEQVNKDKCIKI